MFVYYYQYALDNRNYEEEEEYMVEYHMTFIVLIRNINYNV